MHDFDQKDSYDHYGHERFLIDCSTIVSSIYSWCFGGHFLNFSAVFQINEKTKKKFKKCITDSDYELTNSVLLVILSHTIRLFH